MRSVVGGVGLALAMAAAAMAASPGRPGATAQGTSRADARVGDAAIGVAWVEAGSIADVEAAFARARREQRPVFLYWGAAWCPPCQHLKATLFPREDFIALSRRVVAVHVDGDRRGAQALAARYAVRGYPTTLLFDAAGRELTRLPGEVDAPQYLQALRAVIETPPAAGPVRSSAEWVAGALRGEALPDAAWQQLAWYSWETDEQRLAALGPHGAAGLLATLAQSCPPRLLPAWIRLQLRAALAAAGDTVRHPLGEAARRDAGAALMRLLGDPDQSRRQMDLVTGTVRELLPALAPAGTAERAQVQAAWSQAVERLRDDATLSRADRLGAWMATVELARQAQGPSAAPPIGAASAGTPPPPPATTSAAARPDDTARPLDASQQARLRRDLAGYLAAATDAEERQTLVTGGAYLLARAGLRDESDRLLLEHLAGSPWPYYLMSQLAGNARARGDAAGALQWLRRAWESARGAATRAQWGAGYLAALVDTTPDDAQRIEQVAARVLAELAREPDAFEGRNQRAVERIAGKLGTWNAMGDQAAAMARLARPATAVCARAPRVDGRRAACEALFAKLRAGSG